ncbi:MAG: PrgI family protein, partial [Oscillospiraceae bacterium]|nr:PrgI family protein [Oscillospiraceae bacterium]
MAYVSVPKDLTKVKSKVIFNLTKRQLICFGAAAAIGVPTYFLTKSIIGNTAAVMVMIILMLPAFFIAMYEKDGLSAEKILLNIIRANWYYPPVRPYKTENFYHVIELEGKIFGESEKAASSGKTSESDFKTNDKK